MENKNLTSKQPYGFVVSIVLRSCRRMLPHLKQTCTDACLSNGTQSMMWACNHDAVNWVVGCFHKSGNTTVEYHKCLQGRVATSNVFFFFSPCTIKILNQNCKTNTLRSENQTKMLCVFPEKCKIHIGSEVHEYSKKAESHLVFWTKKK